MDNSRFPWFINEYLKTKNYPLNTLKVTEFNIEFFLNWLIEKSICNAPLLNITLGDLECIKINDIKKYKQHLENKYAERTVANKISSINSLFHYLAYVAEYNNGTPYLTRNVISQLKGKSVNKSDKEMFEHLKNNIIFTDTEVNSFRNFVKQGYGDKIKLEKKLSYYYRDRERDAAIISLLIGSGIKVSELTNIQISQVDLLKDVITIERKPHQITSINLSEHAIIDLKLYLDVRSRIKSPDLIPYVFLSKRNDEYKQLKTRAIQNLISKYAIAFGRPELNAQNLRHSFAIRSFKQNKSVDYIAEQLGTSGSINPIWAYTKQFERDGSIYCD